MTNVWAVWVPQGSSYIAEKSASASRHVADGLS